MENKEFLGVVKALDHRDKIRIIDLILTEGKKSITDIRKQLKLSFSTVHKYLNQMEAAGVLISEKVSEGGRQKKLYSIKSFDFHLTPKFLSSLVRPQETSKEVIKSFNIINWEGSLINFSPTELKKRCINAGMPVKVVDSIMKRIGDRLYDGMSSSEIRDAIFSELENEKESIENARKQLSEIDIFIKRRNLLTKLNEVGYKEVADSNNLKDYWIRNIGRNSPITIHHNFSYILKHGLKVIGVDALPAKRMNSAISHIGIAIGAIQNNLANPIQSFDCLNVFLAPFIKDMAYVEVEHELTHLLSIMRQVNEIDAIETAIGLETSVPEFLRNKPVYVGGKEAGIYDDYQAETERLFEIFIKLIAKSKYTYPKIVLKIRDGKYPEICREVIDKVYISNLRPKWQTENASYGKDWCRLDSSWKDWKKSMGTGLAQMVTLNLPKLGFATNNETIMFERLNELIEKIKKVFLISSERITSKMYTELKFLSRSLGKDKYFHLDDCICLIGLCGLSDLVKNTGVEPEKIISFLNKNKDIPDTSIRIELIENIFIPTVNRFLLANNHEFKRKDKSYIGGIQTEGSFDEKLKYYSIFHKQVLGGHNAIFDKLSVEKANKLLKSDVGMFCSKKSVINP